MNRREFLKGAAAAAGALAATPPVWPEPVSAADPLGQRYFWHYEMVRYVNPQWMARISFEQNRVGYDGITRRIVSRSSFAGAGSAGFTRGPSRWDLDDDE